MPNSGPLKFSDIQNIFGGVNPISFSEYYTDSSSGYTTGNPNLVARGNKLKLRNFYNVSKIVDTSSPKLYFNPSISNSYSGTGTTINNIGLIGNTTGTIGTLNNISFNNSIANGVFDFNGSSSINFGQYNFNDKITVSSWVYPRSKYSINTLMSNAGANLSTNGFKLEWNGWNTQNRRLQLEAGNGSSGNVKETSSNDIITENTWQMTTWVIDFTNTTVEIYKNNTSYPLIGGLVSNVSRNNSNWYIGSMAGSYYMNAYLGSIKIWDKLLTSTEITNEFNNTKSRFGIL